MISSSVTSWTLALETLTWSFSVSCARAWLAGWWLTWFSWPSPTPGTGPSPQHWPWWWYSRPCMWLTPSGLRWVWDTTRGSLSRTTIMWRKMWTNILILFNYGDISDLTVGCHSDNHGHYHGWLWIYAGVWRLGLGPFPVLSTDPLPGRARHLPSLVLFGGNRSPQQ